MLHETLTGGQANGVHLISQTFQLITTSHH